MSLRWLLLIVALAACTPSRAASPSPGRAFYYWRTTFELSAAERRALADGHVTRLYVRAFDVAWDTAEARPTVVGALTVVDRAPPGIEIVPVVFVRDQVFRRSPRGRLRELARRTWDEVSRRAARLGVTPRELQLDCDWTDTTRDAFFAYLRELRAVSGRPLSATIRLHQIKYRERTGVPPVERGMLMYYNMGSFSADPHDRAIFDAAAAARYLARLETYPLPLDVALPIWSWTVHVRDGQVIDLLQTADPDELPGLDFVVRAAGDRFVVTRTAFLHGALLRAGDVLKIERMAPDDTLAAAHQVAPHLAPGDRAVALFDLSERNLTRYGHHDLERIFGAVR